ncbi:MAG: class I SAM-dependent methyltransferase [Chloroflexi bacterium]|nr:class I SAM-dependent methyltransferase [Chloroflexota bacterium]
MQDAFSKQDDATQRFSSRVENYVKYRPCYPREILTTLRAECHLTPAAVIADVGSGTGILARLFLENGNRVLGIEPNAEMRAAAERLLEPYGKFTSIAARAEATPLADRSVDFVTAGQAFHWFDEQKARVEFARILQPDGWVVLVWNERKSASTPFLVAYEEMLRKYGTDYPAVDHTRISDEDFAAFYGPQGFKFRTYENHQVFDYESLKGRLLSSSYTPQPGHLNHEPMLEMLAGIFHTHQVDRRIIFAYETKMYYGHLS